MIGDGVERRPERVAGEVVGVCLDIPCDLGERHLAASVVGEDVVVPRDGAGKIVVRVGESEDGRATGIRDRRHDIPGGLQGSELVDIVVLT